MNLVFISIVVVLSFLLIVFLSVPFFMVLNMNKNLASFYGTAQGELENIRSGQMLNPDSLPEGSVISGICWNQKKQRHERQTALSLSALREVYL